MSTIGYAYTTLDTDAELSRLIGTLKLNTKVRALLIARDAKDERDNAVKDSENQSQDLSMTALQTDDLPQGGFASKAECHFHTNTASHSHDGPFGCPLLLSIHYHIEVYPTTGGAYLNTIFTHRALFHASPKEHGGCARALSDLARKLEDREWRPDRESDQEAATALLNEAMTVASLYRG